MDGEGLVVPVLLGANDVDVGVNPRFGGGADAACGLADSVGRHPVRRDDGGGGERDPVAEERGGGC